MVWFNLLKYKNKTKPGLIPFGTTRTIIFTHVIHDKIVRCIRECVAAAPHLRRFLIGGDQHVRNDTKETASVYT